MLYNHICDICGNRIPFFTVFSDSALSFSALKNTLKIFSTTVSRDSLGCVGGLRVLSMWWVILGHSHSYTLMFIGES